ncbi:hypothetical protein VTK26DRAFT_8925 [Humicola hyalothermophila]
MMKKMSDWSFFGYLFGATEYPGTLFGSRTDLIFWWFIFFAFRLLVFFHLSPSSFLSSLLPSFFSTKVHSSFRVCLLFCHFLFLLFIRPFVVFPLNPYPAYIDGQADHRKKHNLAEMGNATARRDIAGPLGLYPSTGPPRRDDLPGAEKAWPIRSLLVRLNSRIGLVADMPH